MRKKLFLCGLFLLVLSFTVVVGYSSAKKTSGSVLVDLQEVNPRIIIDLKYATEDNFLKEKVYDTNRCYALPVLAEKLDAAQKLLEKDGLGLKVFDCFRPVAVQKKMWELVPDSRYVANPYKKGSNHNRGVAVDLTIVDKDGNELAMPTPFDTFTDKAHKYSMIPTAQERANRLLLRLVMEKVGLEGINTEWWHFQLPDAEKYPLIEDFPK
ncbi:MAG: D-alanyl-D-alanine dipeptidase [Clostridia bacterium]|nr:D-alanyl-D-alanine dipeptidase [Clostridia bacterium]